ncbi:hypothetical protein [Microbulbifer hydrolyticus]|uniref:Uncharacterized protein n=1 Tax=Microbulbifer hydrolyticus TaxID=48074 RepID=A0A6P1T9U3_9GAMM|nr:hypothetical protein [Microbulbifer hydrolyticus]MBB5213334.1 hypothetical protein [Microbulbifer hydrolyticus]QHQ38591.1 hypothetical protein GTQ55_06055 [Microbulbifer hydrolyticus]
MKTYAALILSFFSALAQATDAMRAVGSVLEEREINLAAGEESTVPPCTRWVLKNAHNLDESSWFKIDGKVRIVSTAREFQDVYYTAEGSFKLIPGMVLGPQMALLEPGTNVIAFSQQPSEAFWFVEQKLYMGIGKRCANSSS